MLIYVGELVKTRGGWCTRALGSGADKEVKPVGVECSGVIGLHDVCASVRVLHGLDDGDCRTRLPDAPCA